VVDIEGGGVVDGQVVVPAEPAAAGEGAVAGHGGGGDRLVDEDLFAGVAAVLVGVDPAAELLRPVAAGAVLILDRAFGRWVTGTAGSSVRRWRRWSR
jgi:hypothetical protein